MASPVSNGKNLALDLSQPNKNSKIRLSGGEREALKAAFARIPETSTDFTKGWDPSQEDAVPIFAISPAEDWKEAEWSDYKRRKPQENWVRRDWRRYKEYNPQDSWTEAEWELYKGTCEQWWSKDERKAYKLAVGAVDSMVIDTALQSVEPGGTIKRGKPSAYNRDTMAPIPPGFGLHDKKEPGLELEIGVEASTPLIPKEGRVARLAKKILNCLFCR